MVWEERLKGVLNQEKVSEVVLGVLEMNKVEFNPGRWARNGE